MGEVARAAGVTLSTVSRTLNRPDRVTEQTRQRVLDAVDQLGYVPNAAAVAMRTTRRPSIGVMLLGFGNPFFASIADAIEDAASEAGAVVALQSSSRDRNREQRLLRRIGERHFDGIIATPLDVDDPLLDVIVGRGTPVVVFLREVASGRHCSVRGDDRLGGRMAGEHLVLNGHRRMAYAGPVEGDRWSGASRVWGEAGVPHQWLPTAAAEIRDGLEVVEQLAAISPDARPTGLFCENDLIAVGVVQAARQRGWRVPDDLAVVGYDDTALANAASAVGLTTVRQPAREMAQAAVDVLFEEISGDHSEHREVLFQPALVVRASSGPQAEPAAS